MEQKKVLIVGAQGMLGQALVQIYNQDASFVVTAWDKDEIDVTNFALFEARLRVLRPNIILNTVAYNAVDACETDETEYAKALTLNRDVPHFLARQSAELDYVLVHYSTDYVFDGALKESETVSGCCGGGCCGKRSASAGTGKLGYTEDALPQPLSRYGMSKLAGEQAVTSLAQRYYVIRLSKLFGAPGISAQAKRSFFAVMLDAGRTKGTVQAVNDEKSCFTYAPDLAHATKDLIESGDAWGLYHLPNSGGVTWYEAVQELYRQAGISTMVTPVDAEAFPRPAKRPHYSVLLNTKRPALRPYQEALTDYLRSIATEKS
ncbi:MAG: SDR family oxidoreductase [Minisyncoccota bacterium]